MHGKTVAREASCTGIGLHTGDRVRVTLRPREEQGIVFVREDLPGRPRVRACVSNVVFERRRTALRAGEGEVHTAEHLLAALYASGIDAVEIGRGGERRQIRVRRAEKRDLVAERATGDHVVMDRRDAARPWIARGDEQKFHGVLSRL